MTVTQPGPIRPYPPTDLDPDWERIRARVMERLAGLTPAEWSDHNVADPGVTLAEHAAFGLADLHYRMAERHFDGWPVEVRDWEQDSDRHWSATLTPGGVGAVAEALAAPATSAAQLEPLIRGCVSYVDAVALLSKAPWSGAFAAEQRPMVVALMRNRLVREVAQEHAHVIAQTVEAQRDAGRDLGRSVADCDADAAAELAFTLPLWDSEIAAVVRRERRRLVREALVARLDAVQAVTLATAQGVADDLAKADLDSDEVSFATAAAPQPFDLPGTGQRMPEALEDAGGRSLIWPPHAIQALTCEPVTADDYARRARAHPDVGRAWAAPGRLDGVAWNGLPTDTTPDIAVDEDAAAVTLVVEWVGHRPASPNQSQTQEFLRDVLQLAIGTEARQPFPDFRVDTDELEPRRTTCDEVGAGVLAVAPILVKATLVTGVGADRAAVVADVRARIAAFFSAGRPESRPAAPTGDVDGPWPRIEQPLGGWIPGDPIRFAEVVGVMVGNPELWGVEEMAMKVEGAASFTPQSDGALEIPRNAVPALADANCMKVRFSLTSECGDA
jgi:hypothetical protein